MERCFISCAIGEMQTMKYCYIPIRMATIWTLTAPNTGEDLKQNELSFTAVGMQNGTTT